MLRKAIALWNLGGEKIKYRVRSKRGVDSQQRGL